MAKSKNLLLDTETASAVIGNLKRAFSRSPTVQEFLRKQRVEKTWYKKDGTEAKKKHVFYKCAQCNQYFNSNQIQVDHIEPVIPLNIPLRHVSYDVVIKRLFCDDSNLQILCKEHHKQKSKQENAIRKEWLIKVKYIVYQTVNKINNKRYIGVHKCVDFDDGYLGSGTLVKMAFNKHHKDNFYRVIIDVFDNIEDALLLEKDLVNHDIVRSDEYYNIAIGGVYAKNNNAESNKKEVICHQTQEKFDSVSEAAESINISASSISKVLNNPNISVKNLHFFTLDSYRHDVVVTYSNVGRHIVCINTGKHYISIKKAADDLSLNYKSLRNAFVEKTDEGLYKLNKYYFLYEDEYDPDTVYKVKHKKVVCIELNRVFDSCSDAARFIGHQNPDFGGIAISKAIRNNSRQYKYTWKYIYQEQILNL